MTEYVVHEEEYKGLIIKIYPDDDPGMNPVEDWDMLGRQVYWHRRYTLGHCWKETSKYSPEEWLIREIEQDYLQQEAFDEIENMSLEELMEEFKKYNLVIPVHAYEHGGITISTGRFNDPFDSGQLGFVYVSHKDIIKEYGDLSKRSMDLAEKILNSEVSEYDSYLRGEVYGYRVFENSDGEAGDELESCWGFIGDYNRCLDEAKSQADWWANKFREDQAELDNRMQG